MWRQRDRNKMGLRTTQRELEEKIQKKKSDGDGGLVKMLLDQMASMSKQLNKLNKNVEEIKDKNPTVITVSGNGTEVEKTNKKYEKMFIPSVSTGGMSINAGEVTKRSRQIDLSDSVDDLTQMENDND